MTQVYGVSPKPSFQWPRQELKRAKNGPGCKQWHETTGPIKKDETELTDGLVEMAVFIVYYAFILKDIYIYKKKKRDIGKGT